MEVFRSGNKWKVIGGTCKSTQLDLLLCQTRSLFSVFCPLADENKEDEEERELVELVASSRYPHNSPKESSKGRKQESPVRKTRHDSPDISPPRKSRHDSPDLSPSREFSRKPEKVQRKGEQ